MFSQWKEQNIFLFSFIKGGATEKAHKFLTSVSVNSGTHKELVVSVLSEHCKTVALHGVFKMTLEAASFIKESTTEKAGRSITFLHPLKQTLVSITY